MINLMQTPSDENQMVWLFQLLFDDSTVYAGTESVLAGGHQYDADVIQYESISAFTKSIGMSEGVEIDIIPTDEVRLKILSYIFQALLLIPTGIYFWKYKFIN